MFFKKKIVTPDMIDWYHDPDQLTVFGSHTDDSTHDLLNYKAEKTLLVFLGGAMDDVYRPMLQGVFIPYRLKHVDHQDSCYATHAAIEETIQLIRYWHSAGQKIALIGHSWGGKSVFLIANKLTMEKIPIELLVTLDPVSRRYFRRQFKKPYHVKRWINVHVDYGKASMEYSNVIARLGGYWSHCQYADKNIKLSHDQEGEITHAMAGRMFAEVEKDMLKL